MAVSEPVLLANIANPNSHTLAAYEATGGYRTWRAVLAEQSPQDVQDLVTASACADAVELDSRPDLSGRSWARIAPARSTSA